MRSLWARTTGPGKAKPVGRPKEVKCTGYMDTKDCSYCGGTGDDMDMTGSGMCGYCTNGQQSFFNTESCEHCQDDSGDLDYDFDNPIYEEDRSK
jgi:hypothetical protein